MIVTPTHGIVFVRVVDLDGKNLMEEFKKEKKKLDKDCIFLWRLLQDIFKSHTINFTGIIAAPNVTSEEAKNILCKNCSDLVMARKYLEGTSDFNSWIHHHLKSKSQMKSDIFVDTVTRLNGLYVLFETPQQNLDSKESLSDKADTVDNRVVKHVAKVLLTTQQYEILTSTLRHRYLRINFECYIGCKVQIN